MVAPVRKPFVGQAPILNEPPAADDWGQITRPILDVPVPIEGVAGGEPVPVTGTLVVTPQPAPNTGAVARVPVSLLSVTLAAANAGRRGLQIHSDSRRPLLIRAAAGPCTTANWTTKLFYNDTFILNDGDYLGEVTGMWLAADPSGGAQVTEWTRV
jgi:hypothetical protein